MNNSGAYRANAEACARLAETVDNPYTRLVLLNIAEGWLRLAAYIDRRKQNEVGGHFGVDSSPDQDASPE
jgi:hypothetical protein